MKRYLLILTTLLLTAQGSFADLKLSSLFQDHMVLQRETKVPVWGTADPGKDVTVKFGTQSVSGKADDKGNWRVELTPMPANATGQLMTVTSGDKTVTAGDILIGDVWICSGQSNMAFALTSAITGKDELPKANFPNIRLFSVKQAAMFTPQTSCGGQWTLCTPDSAKSFSAVGYYFGKETAATENVPVGLIGSNVGGTTAQAWTSLDGLQADPDLDKAFAQETVKLAADPAGANGAHDAWMASGGTAYKDAMTKWHMDDYAAKQKNLPEPPKPTAPATPEPPYEGDGKQAGDNRVPSSLYNGMIAPLEPFAIKGVIWYQGESGGVPYDKIFDALINSWRKHWGQGDFPFLYVQLPNFGQRATDPNAGGGWAVTREAQFNALKLPNTGMAITIDVGDGNNLHPPYKDVVGHRLALVAQHVAYGKDLVYSGPLFDSAKIDGAKVVVTFKETGTGLKLGVPPVAPPGSTPPPTDAPQGFAVAGKDLKFAWAKASITAPNTITVTCDTVTQPMYVRYAWGSNPEVNLYNSADLPASPFRTDPPTVPPPMAKPPAPPAAPKPATAPAN
jgi:sialate O-acetylesterase